MDKFDELVKKLNGLHIMSKSMDWEECLPGSIWGDFGEYRTLCSGLDVDKHRWYEASITVIEVHGRLLGIKNITNVYSENSSCEDCCFTLGFFEMKAIPTTSYVRVVDSKK